MATAQGAGAFQGTTATLTPGLHVIYAYATDGQEATSAMGSPSSGAGGSPLISNIVGYMFMVYPSSQSAVSDDHL